MGGGDHERGAGPPTTRSAGTDPPEPRRDGAPESVRPSLAGYELESRLAVGGMSEVFLARKAGEPAGSTFVIKRLLADLAVDPEARQAFALEGSIHAAIKHPNVVEVLEVGDHAGEPFLVLEYVRGVDAHRLIRRAEAEKRQIPPGVAVHVARQLCAALEAVHGLRDEQGRPLRVVHRDVTPSNVYLSMTGDVKLGDFGIAWTASGRRPVSSLKGKFNYLAPEQVSAESLDHRADLFSLAVLLAELILGGPLFDGAGQLAILLAIRDVRIDRLRAIEGRLPEGLFPVLEKALSKAPGDRYASAAELADALAPFAALPGAARKEIAALVAWARDASSLAKRLEGYLLDARRSSGPPTEERPVDSTPITRRVPDLDDLQREADGPASARGRNVDDPLCGVRTRLGKTRKIAFTKVLEAIATGQLGPDDDVDLGQGLRPLGTIAALARYLPASTGTTTRVEGPGVPDYQVSLDETPLPDVLAWVVRQCGTGALFLEGDAPADESGPARKELYFEDGKLALAVSSEPSELLGEYLVRSGKIDRSELELALLVMHKYDGQLGDTLIALGLVDAVAVFQAIRAQGRERVTSAFLWTRGRATFYRDVRPTRNDFRLDLDVPALLMAGLARARHDDVVLAHHLRDFEHRFRQVRPTPSWAKRTTWPSTIVALMQALGDGRALGEAVDLVVEGGRARRTGLRVRPAEVLRAFEAAIAMGIAERLD